MARLLLDFVNRHTGLNGAGDQPGAQAVARDVCGVQPHGLGVVLEDQRNGLSVQLIAADHPGTVDWPEDRTAFDPGQLQLVFYRFDRAGAGSTPRNADLATFCDLVSLAPAQVNHHTLPHKFNITEVQCGQF